MNCEKGKLNYKKKLYRICVHGQSKMSWERRWSDYYVPTTLMYLHGPLNDCGWEETIEKIFVH